MMSIQPSELKALTWWEYQAMLWNWNDRHAVEEQEVDAPDADFFARRMNRLAASGLARSIH